MRPSTLFGDRFISIHALRGEGDKYGLDKQALAFTNFNPRPPWGGRLVTAAGNILPRVISIHALRGEGD